jgi:hypothetical protein
MGFNKVGQNKKRKREINEEIMKLENMEEMGQLSETRIRKKNALKVELLKILGEEEYWYKRSHENWLLKGDSNTEFFHKVANGKRRKQTIFFLNGGGSVYLGMMSY